jgi:hypothetical protein
MLNKGGYIWLDNALLKIRDREDMELENRVGLVMSMFALEGILINHIGTFLRDLDKSCRTNVIIMLEK